ncbi:hypothetical protein J437_LFUL009779 [Ladona fulva]|uniref:XPG-I domain-containing protein n=1 Tax=Ladona fulva TaxID=123851 RepID=A0A8K0K2J6_LADFU|nr:hypothetical protein J437_LFUL009779 [Ladona fulva]
MESEMLNEKKVKDFIRVAIGGSEDGSDVEDIESKEELWGEPEDGLSQAELLELIKEQNECKLESKPGTENMQKDSESLSEGMESKEVSRSISVTDHGKNSGLLKEIKLEVETNIENQIVDMNCNESIGISKGDSSFVASKAVRDENEEQVEAHKKGDQITADITLESEEELSDIEITGIVKEKLKTQDVVENVKGSMPSCKVMVKTTIETFTKEEKDRKGKCRKITEDLIEEVIVEEKESEGLTQEEILALIKTQSKSTVEDKAKDDATSGTSDSESFLEVEEAATDEEKKVPNPEKSEKPAEDSIKIVNEKESNKLEVVIHPDENPDDSSDIFADVFESGTAEEDTAMDKNEPALKRKVTVVAEIPEENVEEPMKDVDVSENVSETNEDDREIHPLEDEMDESLTEEERHRMTLEMKKLEREANTGVTERARLESQELLGLFGVPWVVAPFEAEAQCAFLEKVSPKSPKFGSSSSIRKFLAEGTVTEDSDIWAFGAATVYRHVFDRRRTRVRLYTKEDIYKKLGLTRMQVVQLALLTGSDYTIGLPGVGTVTALEILAAFPGEKSSNPGSSEDAELDDVISGMEHFADWWKRMELNEEKGEPVGHSYHDPKPEIAEKLRRRLLACWKTLQSKQPGASLLPAGFPSRAVAQAYLKPSVDDCRDTFTWLKPDEAALRSYAQLHFGWTKEKTDSILRPLFARLKLSDCKDRTQTSLHSFFSHLRTDPRPGDLDSANVGVRAMKALERIAGKLDDNTKGSADEDVEQQGRGDGRKANVSSERSVPKMRKALNPKRRGGGKVMKEMAEDKVITKVKDVTKNMETGFSSSLYSSDNIPQRQKDNNNALQSKLKAIEVLRMTSMGRGKRPKEGAKKGKDAKKLRREEVKLSESSESD